MGANYAQLSIKFYIVRCHVKSESAGRSVKMSKESEQCQLIVRASLQSFHGAKSYGIRVTKLKPSLVMIVVGRP